MKKLSYAVLSVSIFLAACTGGSQKSKNTVENQNMFTGAKGEENI